MEIDDWEIWVSIKCGRGPWTVDRGPTKMWTFAHGLLPLGPLYSKLTSPLCMTKKWTHNKILQKIKFELKYIFQLITYHNIIKGG